MSTVQIEEVKRAAICLQTTGIRQEPGSGHIALVGLTELSVQATENPIEDGSNVTSRMIKQGSKVGARSFVAAFKIPAHSTLVAQLGDVFISCLGEKIADSALVFSTGDANTFTVSSGKIAPLVKYVDNAGNFGVRPVKSVDGTDLIGTWAIKPDLDTSLADVTNPSDNSGAMYRTKPRADLKTFEFQSDAGDEPDQENYVGLGCVPTKFLISISPEERLFFDIELSGADYLDKLGSYISSLSDYLPAFESGFQFSGNCALYIGPLATPFAGNDANLVEFSSIEFDIAPEIRTRKSGLRPALGATTNPGSAITGYERGFQHAANLKINTLLKTYPDNGGTPKLWKKVWDDGDELQIFILLRGGNPGSAIANNMIAFWFQKCVLNAKPEESIVDGMIGSALEFKVLEDSTLDEADNIRAQMQMAIFA